MDFSRVPRARRVVFAGVFFMSLGIDVNHNGHNEHNVKNRKTNGLVVF